MQKEEIISYLQFSPYYVYGEKETPLQLEQKKERYFAMPLNLRQVCLDFATSDKIREIAIDKNSLPLLKARRLSYLIRLVFFGELSVADFINRIAEDLKIEKTLAQNIALEVNQEIFKKAVKELKEIQGKIKRPAMSRNLPNQQPQPTTRITPTPPSGLPTLEREYERSGDKYLEPVTNQKPIINGNVVNLK